MCFCNVDIVLGSFCLGLDGCCLVNNTDVITVPKRHTQTDGRTDDMHREMKTNRPKTQHNVILN